MITAAQQHAQRNRNTIFVEDGELLEVETFAGDQFIMRIRAPKCARAALPGSFVHLTCDDTLPMRRPLSIMRAEDDSIEVLYKIVGDGLRWLSKKRPGDLISVLGPIGQPFKPSADRPNTVLIGGGVGIPPMVFVAEHFKSQRADWSPLAILGSELPFPFAQAVSTIETAWLDSDINRTMPLMENLGIPCRLTSQAGFDGCFRGFVTDLARLWLEAQSADALAKTEFLACGPTPMLKAVAMLAAEYNVPCQVSLEEFMACAVGGCAGCTVEINTPDGPAMKRVCVDGPVFDAASVAW